MLKALQTARGSRIAGLGYFRPDQRLDNAEIGRRAGVDPEWIETRTGIRSRCVAGPNETVTDMAFEAAQKALAASDRSPDEVDTVIVATSTAESSMPSVAPRVAARLGLSAPGGFDLNNACAGFCYALATADALIRAGSASCVLVIGVDKPTGYLDWADRGTAILFGDGAGAAVLVGADKPQVGPVSWGTVGDHADLIGIDPDRQVLGMSGRAVFRWATGLAPLARAACDRAGVDPADLAGFVPHQANARIIDILARELGLERCVVSRDVVSSGNTIAASIPLALARLVEHGDVPPGGPLLLFGFGAGLAYAGQVVVL
jgi:3-oxoacyl-[acyl-carrier-protein] synthase-3